MIRDAEVTATGYYLQTYRDVYGYEPIYETSYNVSFTFVEEEEQQQVPPSTSDDGVGAAIH